MFVVVLPSILQVCSHVYAKMYILFLRHRFTIFISISSFYFFVLRFVVCSVLYIYIIMSFHVYMYIHIPPLSPADTPSQDVLERFQSTAGQQTTVDVYLGKERCHANVNGVPHAMLNGWLGSIPYQNRMTYGNLLDLVKRYLPVSAFILVQMGEYVSTQALVIIYYFLYTQRCIIYMYKEK